MSELAIRDARPDERDAIRALTLAAYNEFATVMEPAAWAGLSGAVRSALATADPAERIVAERDGALVGSVMLYPPTVDPYGGIAKRVTWPEIRLLAVDPAARGGGIGEALVNECARRSLAAGFRELGLHTSHSLAAAVRMYERIGFRRIPEYDFHPEGGELVMAYRLPLDVPARSDTA